MIETLRWLGILTITAFRDQRDLALENLALRQQLGVLKRKGVPRLQPKDRLFWVVLSRIWPRWRKALHLIKADTVVGWQQKGLRIYWARISQRKSAGRCPVSSEVRVLIQRMATANPCWGAPRIHGELLKLGIEISERTVSRLLPKGRKPPSQTWKAFLNNHLNDLVSIDFFSVPTVTFRVLFVLVAISHYRRRVVYFNVTGHPTAVWTGQQFVQAFPEETAPRYLLRDRDKIYGNAFQDRVSGMDIEEILTAPQSPWQSPYVERLIGSIRRDCLDHVIVLGEQHLGRILTSYLAYYHRSRTHLSLDKDAPEPRAVQPPKLGTVVELPEVGGHSSSVRAAGRLDPDWSFSHTQSSVNCETGQNSSATAIEPKPLLHREARPGATSRPRQSFPFLDMIRQPLIPRTLCKGRNNKEKQLQLEWMRFWRSTSLASRTS